ncbi:MAG: 1-(5-phosphoribosyl)-5-[(5-phosphoribosylamino)methylideneamino] imidazole-4-carboxamide isomerase [Albidovulum sp.]|nr:1-(5-phosphoribosyl)-5-[(5-phosphoribosylamino)methylideneamino] imidazole-4-carboxamide isomerase [Albidovulum sp.]
MIIYPTIQLMNGRCVSLFRGRTEEPRIWHVDPLEKAKEFYAAGAEWMHITDFDAMEGDYRNSELILSIIRQVGIAVQLGGGFRSQERIAEWIDLGVGRIVLGTLAVQNQAWAKRAAKLFPDQIVVSVDVWKGSVMIGGWRNKNAIPPEKLIDSYLYSPLAGFIVTDIDSSVDQRESSLALVTSLASLARSPVIASGLIRTSDDVSRLKYVPNVAGAIVGTALLEKTVELEEALAIAQPTPESKAEFI